LALKKGSTENVKKNAKQKKPAKIKSEAKNGKRETKTAGKKRNKKNQKKKYQKTKSPTLTVKKTKTALKNSSGRAKKKKTKTCSRTAKKKTTTIALPVRMYMSRGGGMKRKGNDQKTSHHEGQKDTVLGARSGNCPEKRGNSKKKKTRGNRIQNPYRRSAVKGGYHR